MLMKMMSEIVEEMMEKYLPPVELYGKKVHVIPTPMVQAIAVRLFGKDYIMVTDGVLKMDEEAVRCVLAHEEGHIELGHLDRPYLVKVGMNIRRNMLALFTSRVCKQELEADEYAAQKEGVEAMKRTLSGLMDVLPEGARKEMTARMGMLKERSW